MSFISVAAPARGGASLPIMRKGRRGFTSAWLLALGISVVALCACGEDTGGPSPGGSSGRGEAGSGTAASSGRGGGEGGAGNFGAAAGSAGAGAMGGFAGANGTGANGGVGGSDAGGGAGGIGTAGMSGAGASGAGMAGAGASGMSGNGGAGTLEPYGLCDTSLGNTNNPECPAPGSACNGWCAPPCSATSSTGDDCPDPLSGTTSEKACNFHLCYLLCGADATCPDGLRCANDGSCRR